MQKDELRLETNKLLIRIVQSLMKEEGITQNWIIDNLDEFARSCMGTGCQSASTATKFSKSFSYNFSRRPLFLVHEDT